MTLFSHLRTLAALLEDGLVPGRLVTSLTAPECRPMTGPRKGNETHISAQQDQARPHARLSRPHGDQGRPPGIEASSRQRPRAAHAVSAPTVGPTGTSSGLAGSSSNRFSKDNRLLDAAAYGRVFDAPSRSRDQFFTVLCRRNDGDQGRLGLAVSRKHCRRAVARNRIKRIARESFRQQQDLMAGLDVVVINQPAAANASNNELFASLEKHWQNCQKARNAGPRIDG